ncbi:YdcF family protein [Undibacterium sp. CY18W]|uniref:YdcF family protein n=1 Tax=Undibacterium hunanense TaxID=2762292 RepID=A0ABR6ZYT0_9BURK|nr:YdcF family protein [Undibacterium hunanense]
MKRLLAWLALILLSGFLLAMLAISLYGLNDRLASTDLAIVPGNTVHPDGTPSKRLQARLDAALKLFVDGRCKAILVSGAKGVEGYDEAEVMKNYLLAHGVPATAIHIDSHGINTLETARFAASLMKQKGWTSAVLVSQFFHLARFQLAMNKFGLSGQAHVHADYFEGRDAYSLAREVFAYGGYMLKPSQVR